MVSKKIILRPELSAQGIRKNPNPILRKAIEVALEAQKNGKNMLIVDCGCGQLRNVQTLLTSASTFDEDCEKLTRSGKTKPPARGIPVTNK